MLLKIRGERRDDRKLTNGRKITLKDGRDVFQIFSSYLKTGNWLFAWPDIRLWIVLFKNKNITKMSCYILGKNIYWVKILSVLFSSFG